MKNSWHLLHNQSRFLPKYPSEDVVRFVFTHLQNLAKNGQNKILDLGCGGVRHTKLLAQEGFSTYASDFSTTGLQHTAKTIKQCDLHAELIKADMHKLPFINGSFDGLVAFGCLYYTDWQGIQEAVNEIHRVLKNNGVAFIQVRTKKDCRFNQGIQIDDKTFQLATNDTNEKGMRNCFLDENDVNKLFKIFRHISLDLNEVSLNNRQIKNSDWIIIATK